MLTWVPYCSGCCFLPCGTLLSGAPFVFPPHTNSLSASLKSRLHNLCRSLSSLALLSRPALCMGPRQMLRFNALIWPAVSSSVSLIVVHLVPSKTLSSNLGEMALAQTNRHLWGSSLVFSLLFLPHFLSLPCLPAPTLCVCVCVILIARFVFTTYIIVFRNVGYWSVIINIVGKWWESYIDRSLHWLNWNKLAVFQ